MGYLRNHYEIIGLTLVSAFLCFFGIGSESYSLDEASSLVFTSSFSELGRIISTSETNMWLFYGLLVVWQDLVGTAEWATRLLPAVFAIGTTPLVYLISKTLFNRKTAVLSVILFSLNYTVIEYAQDLRSYSMALFFCTFMSYVGTILLHKMSQTGSYRVLFVLSAIAAVYSHLFSVFAVAIVWAAIVFVRWRHKQSVVPEISMAVSIGAALIPLAYFERQVSVGMLNWIPAPDISAFIDLAISFSGYSKPLTVLYGILTVIAVVTGSGRERGTIGALIAYAAVPAGMVFVLSHLFTPMFVPRYFMMFLPAYTILIAYGIGRIPFRGVQLICVICSILLALPPLVTYYNNIQKDDWRAAVPYVSSQSQTDTQVILYPSYLYKPYSFYLEDYTYPDKPEQIHRLNAQEQALPVARSIDAPHIILLTNQKRPEAIDDNLRELTLYFGGTYSSTSTYHTYQNLVIYEYKK